MVRCDQSHDCIHAGIAVLMRYSPFVATDLEDFGQGRVEGTLPEFVSGSYPTTCDIKTLDFDTIVVPEP